MHPKILAGRLVLNDNFGYSNDNMSIGVLKFNTFDGVRLMRCVVVATASLQYDLGQFPWNNNALAVDMIWPIFRSATPFC